jgi:hypothetical protein
MAKWALGGMALAAAAGGENRCHHPGRQDGADYRVAHTSASRGHSSNREAIPHAQFSDLSDQQIAALVRWIHYARAQGRYREITAAKDLRPGDPASGKMYCDEKCGSCHSFSGDMANLAEEYDASTLRDKILRPKFLEDASSWRLQRLRDQKTAAALKRHQALLENYSADDVQNLTAYLKTPR